MSEGTDLLSELLRPIRLTGVFRSWWRLGAPWAVDGDDDSSVVLHHVAEGTCWVEGGTGEAVRLTAGDLAVFPTGVAHRLADRPGRHGTPLRTLLPDRRPGSSDELVFGGDGDTTRILCAGLHHDPGAASSLYRSLPWMLVLERDRVEREPMLREVVDLLLACQDDGPGARLVTLRVFEMAFVLLLRPLLQELADRPELLVASRHPAVSRALLVMHTRFGEPWTVDSLAREVGMSRSAFTACFRDLVGQSPASYLTGRRMSEAARLLAETDVPLTAIPARIGYHSAVGFHLAFRKHHGTTPGDYRSAVDDR